MLATFFRQQLNGVNLHVYPTQRFKTTTISLFIGTLLDEQIVTQIALIPHLLLRGNTKFPETIYFREALDQLYGASLGFDISKQGNYQLIQFRMDVIQDRFLAEPESTLQQAIHFLSQTILNPVMNHGLFVTKYVDAEKYTLQKKLNAIVNDKGRYAAMRCIQEMFADDPYRLHPLGMTEHLPSITPQSLTNTYQQWIQSSPIDLYVVGNTSLEEVTSIFTNAWEHTVAPQNRMTYHMDNHQYTIKPTKSVNERMKINQGKLNIGLRILNWHSTTQYVTAIIYNGILGAYPHSKLFIHVREKESLAYYASSHLDRHKGVITIQAGIEFANYDKATSIIMQQLNAMKSGNINELEMRQTKAMIANQLREINDRSDAMIAFDFHSIFSNLEIQIEDLIAQIDQVSVLDIVAFAQDINVDTIYFLHHEEGE
jgi:predicted Zn-dependent peptidase